MSSRNNKRILGIVFIVAFISIVFYGVTRVNDHLKKEDIALLDVSIGNEIIENEPVNLMLRLKNKTNKKVNGKYDLSWIPDLEKNYPYDIFSFNLRLNPKETKQLMIKPKPKITKSYFSKSNTKLKTLFLLSGDQKEDNNSKELAIKYILARSSKPVKPVLWGNFELKYELNGVEVVKKYYDISSKEKISVPTNAKNLKYDQMKNLKYDKVKTTSKPMNERTKKELNSKLKNILPHQKAPFTQPGLAPLDAPTTKPGSQKAPPKHAN